MDKTWMTLTEAFKQAGAYLFPKEWTGTEINSVSVGNKRLVLNPVSADELSARPNLSKAEDNERERCKAAIKLLLKLLHSGQIKAQLVLPGGRARDIRSSLWPNPDDWNLSDPHFDQFWFNILSGEASIKPDKECLKSAEVRFHGSDLWHYYVGDTGVVEISTSTCNLALSGLSGTDGGNLDSHDTPYLKSIKRRRRNNKYDWVQIEAKLRDLIEYHSLPGPDQQVGLHTKAGYHKKIIDWYAEKYDGVLVSEDYLGKKLRPIWEEFEHKNDR